MSSEKRSGRNVSIVIPTLNEERNLPRVFADLGKIRGRLREILIVDGYSKDRTISIARKSGARVIFDKIGKGSAVRKGLSAARGDVIVIMDADCSHTADELPALIKGVEEGNDVCMGSRFMRGGKSDDITFFRYLGNKFFVFLVNLFWGTHYTDLCYGYRSFSRSAARRLRLRSAGFGIETEISIKCAKLRMRTSEVPSYEKTRLFGASNLQTFRDGWLILRTIFSEAFPR
jgi:glycosyltransferase involved in cell wall biosynthesis